MIKRFLELYHLIFDWYFTTLKEELWFSIREVKEKIIKFVKKFFVKIQISYKFIVEVFLDKNKTFILFKENWSFVKSIMYLKKL